MEAIGHYGFKPSDLSSFRGVDHESALSFRREAVDPQEAYSGRLELRYGACFHLLD